jgi:hypothetical protein
MEKLRALEISPKPLRERVEKRRAEGKFTPSVQDAKPSPAATDEKHSFQLFRQHEGTLLFSIPRLKICSISINFSNI